MDALKRRLVHVAANLHPGDPTRRQLLALLKDAGGPVSKLLDKANADFEAATLAARKQQDVTRAQAADLVEKSLVHLGIPVENIRVDARGTIRVRLGTGSWKDLPVEEQRRILDAFKTLGGDRAYLDRQSRQRSDGPLFFIQ